MRSLVLIIFVFLISEKWVFAQLNVSAEIRPRAEYRQGYRMLPDSLPPVFLISQRNRLSFDYKATSYSFFLSLQDVRLWGDQQLRSQKSSLGVNQAWAALDLNKNISVKAGRQALLYDNGRLFAHNNWLQQGQFHDVLKASFSFNHYKMDIVGAYNENEERLYKTAYDNFGVNYKTLGLWHLSRKSETLYASFIAVADGHERENRPQTLYVRGTYGGFLRYDITETTRLQGAAYKQTGKTSTGQNINAYYHSAMLRQSINAFDFAIGYELFSGNNAVDSLNETDAAFSSLYGVGHRYNGYMNYFTNIPLHTKGAGLINPYFYTNVQLSETFSMRLAYHYFMLQNNFIDENKAIDPYLGSEIDLTFKYKISDDADLQFGYFVMFPTSSMKIIKGGGSIDKMPSFAFVMLTVKPVLFSDY